MRRIKSVGGMDLQRNSFGGARKVTPPVIPELSEVKSHEQPAYRGSYIAADQVSGIPPRIPVGQSKKVQPPGRSSPGEDSTTSTSTIGSLYNSSTTSVDSGCASNSTDPPRSVRSSTFQPHPRHSSASSISLQSSSGSSFRHSYHSSCSSLGSNGKLEDDICSLNIEEMVENNVPDSEVINAWLTDLHFEEYYDLFLSAGYDMPTISRMTPEDLTAIGIKKPNHRKRLKEEISKLKISDGLPNYVPFSLEEWLHCIKLSQYVPHLQVQGFRTIDDVTQICIEDLEDIGVYKLGHQKRLLLAIKRIKDLRAGRVTQVRAPPKQQSSFQQEHRQSSLIAPSQPGLSTFHQPPPPSAAHGPIQYHPEFIRIEPHHRSAATASGGSASNQIYSTNEHSFTPQPIYGSQQQQFGATQQPHFAQVPQQQFAAQQPHQQFTTQQQPGYGTHQPHFPPPMRQLPSQDWTKMFAAPAPVVPPRRCYEEGDNSGTAAASFDHFAPLRHHLNVGGGGTLPRPKGYVKPRPVAMIPAHTRTEAEIEQEEGDLKQCFDNQLNKEGNTLPFANDNIGTIRLKPSVHPRIQIEEEESQQETNWQQQQAQEQTEQSNQTIPDQTAATQRSVPVNGSRTAGDVLNDIGSMLADLTNELDAMLHLEKDQPATQ